jgi:signal transduction histidine kinase
VRAISSSPSGSAGIHSIGVAARLRRAQARLVALRWPYSPRTLEVGWAVFSVINLSAMYYFAYWETIPFHFIWISITLLYGFRSWPTGPTLWILGAVMVTTGIGIALDVWRQSEPPEELTEVPLMAAVFIAMVWHAQRKQAAERSLRLVSEQNARLLADQRQFLQDAAHQLRTPITIALGHAELLAEDLTSQQGRDIDVVIGELDRLRRISERLLLIAAAGDPAFLHPEYVSLDQLIAEHVRRWRPTVNRHLRIGQLDAVAVRADRERLGLALDALIENAVRHTGSDDVIQLSVIRGYPGAPARIIVADTGSGIPEDQVPLIFDRFRSGPVHDSDPRLGDDGQSSGTGLGLPLVRAVANAHGGNVTVHSELGKGSEFELTLPAPSGSQHALPVGSTGIGGGLIVAVGAGSVDANGAVDTVGAGTVGAGMAGAAGDAGADSDQPAQARDHGQGSARR